MYNVGHEGTSALYCLLLTLPKQSEPDFQTQPNCFYSLTYEWLMYHAYLRPKYQPTTLDLPSREQLIFKRYISYKTAKIVNI